MSAQKALQGSETETRELLRGTEENNVSRTRGFIDLPSRQINDFSPKGNRKKLCKWQNLPEVIPVLEDDGVGLVVDVLGQVVVVLPNQPQRLLGRIHHATLRDL